MVSGIRKVKKKDQKKNHENIYFYLKLSSNRDIFRYLKLNKFSQCRSLLERKGKLVYPSKYTKKFKE